MKVGSKFDVNVWRGAGVAMCAQLSMAGAAHAQDAQEHVKRGGTLTIALSVEERFINPAIRASQGVAFPGGKIMEPLMERAKGGGVRPVLATDWSSSPDGLKITVKLREGVKWHDGEPFTCDDVAFSAIELWKKRLNFSTLLQANLQSVKCSTPYTAEFNYSKPMPMSLFVAAMPDLGYPVPKHLYEGTDIERNEHNSSLVGTGPFKFEEYRRGQYISMVKNDDYWNKGYPYLDRIVFRVLNDKSAIAAALESGEILAADYNSVSLGDLPRFTENKNFVVTDTGSEAQVTESTIQFNQRNPILKNLNVRKAIYHALNVPLAIDTIFQGHAKLGIGPIPSTDPNYNPDLPRYEYDPELAKRMLDEAGYPVKADGFRFKLRHRAAPWGEFSDYWAQFFAQAMGEIGIQVELVGNDPSAFLQGVYADHDFDTANDWHIYRADPAISTASWLRSGAPEGAPWTNQLGWKSDKLDAVIDAAAIEVDPKVRIDDYKEMQNIIMEELPILYPLHHETTAVVSAKLKNDHNNPSWGTSSWYDLWIDQ